MPLLTFNHKTNKVNIMALKANENTNEQISFEDLEFEAEYVEEYTTITGKEETDISQYDVYKNYECDIGDYLEGYPEVTIFRKKDKSYDSLRVRIIDTTSEEVLDAYFNFPKKDFPYVEGINKGFDFYRNCFDFIYSILRWRDESNVVNSNGEEVNYFKKVNIENFAKYVDQMNRVCVKITEGNPDSSYNSWIITKME